MRLGPGPVPEPPHVVVLVGEEAVRVVAAVLVVAEATAEDSSRFAPWQRAAEAAHHLLLRAHVARAGAAHRASLVPRTDSGRARDCGRRRSGARERVRRPGRQGSAQVEALQRKARRKARRRAVRTGRPGTQWPGARARRQGCARGLSPGWGLPLRPRRRDTTRQPERQGGYLRLSPARGTTVRAPRTLLWVVVCYTGDRQNGVLWG